MSNPRPPEQPGKDIVPVSATSGNGHGSKVPASKHRNFFASFKALTDLFDEQVETCEELCTAWRERNQRADFLDEDDDADYARDVWTRTHDGVEHCLEDLEQLRTTRWKGIDIYHPSAEYLMWRIGEMMKAWIDKLSDEPAANYAEYMAEHLAAKDLNVMIWESVFYDFEENRKSKPPSLAEVLELMGKYKRQWERRLAAIDLDKIQAMGEQTVFAREFKNAVFKEAVLEYLDNHGHTDDAKAVRDGEVTPQYTIIEAVARTEGHSELVAKLEAPCVASEVYKEAQRALVNKDQVIDEWLSLLKNARRRVNRDKSFVCSKCDAGYEEFLAQCVVCDGWNTVVGHKVWEQPFVREQKRREKLEPNDTARLQYKEVKEQQEEIEWQRWLKKETERGKEERLLEEEMEWGRVARGQRIEEELWEAYERYEVEWWGQVALSSDDDRWSKLSEEQIKHIKIHGLPSFTKEERAEHVFKQKRDKLLREIQERLEDLPNLRDQIDDLRAEAMQECLALIPDIQEQLREHEEELRELRAQLSNLE